MFIQDSTTGIVGVQISWAVITAYALQWLKKYNIVASFDNAPVNRSLAVLAAAVTASGISYSFHGGTLIIDGITLASVWHFLSGATQQFALQHASYKALIAPAQPGDVQDALRKNGGTKP